MTRRLFHAIATTASVAALVLGGSATAGATTPSEAPPGGQLQGAAVFRTYDRPVRAYTSTSCVENASTVPDGASVDLLISLCGFLIHLSPAVVKEQVPTTWPAWGAKPFVEDPQPAVLVSHGSGTLTLSWDVPTTVGGVEVQPRAAGSDVFTASYYTGTNGTGRLVGTVQRRASSPDGARLLGADSSRAWQSIVITSRSGADFAVTQIRGS